MPYFKKLAETQIEGTYDHREIIRLTANYAFDLKPKFKADMEALF